MKIDNQARSELQLEWVALYSDNSELKQYDDRANEEHHFGHIDQGKLREFVLVSKANSEQTVSVNFETGLFHVGGEPLRELEIGNIKVPIGTPLSGKSVENKKLIYFRRVRRDFDMGRGTTSASIAYIIGYEAVVGGKKVKELLQVNPSGTITIYEDPEKKEGFTRL